jgi:hypothetical protein
VGTDGKAGVLTMSALDHTDECGETLLCALGDEACASSDAAYSVGYDNVICVVRVILKRE